MGTCGEQIVPLRALKYCDFAAHPVSDKASVGLELVDSVSCACCGV